MSTTFKSSCQVKFSPTKHLVKLTAIGPESVDRDITHPTGFLLLSATPQRMRTIQSRNWYSCNPYHYSLVSRYPLTPADDARQVN